MTTLPTLSDIVALTPLATLIDGVVGPRVLWEDGEHTIVLTATDTHIVAQVTLYHDEDSDHQEYEVALETLDAVEALFDDPTAGV